MKKLGIVFSLRWHQRQRKKLLPLPKPRPESKQGFQGQNDSADSYAQPQKEDLHITLVGQLRYPLRSAVRRMRLDPIPPSASSWLLGQSWGWWQHHIRVHLGVWRLTNSRPNMPWRNSVTLMWPKSVTWSDLMEKITICWTGSWLWCFGCMTKLFSSKQASRLILSISSSINKQIKICA